MQTHANFYTELQKNRELLRLCCRKSQEPVYTDLAESTKKGKPWCSAWMRSFRLLFSCRLQLIQTNTSIYTRKKFISIQCRAFVRAHNTCSLCIAHNRYIEEIFLKRKIHSVGLNKTPRNHCSKVISNASEYAMKSNISLCFQIRNVLEELFPEEIFALAINGNETTLSYNVKILQSQQCELNIP